MISNNDNSLQQQANKIMDRRIENSSKAIYNSKLKAWVKWLKENYPEHLEDDQVKYQNIESTIY